MTLPSTLKTINNSNSYAGAFQGCAALTEINLPEGLSTIGSYAFSGCTALGWTYVPTTVTSIGKNAFNGYGENLTLESEYGAYVISYAKEQGIPYYYLSLTDHDRPDGTLYLGYPFDLYGYVRGSINITRVTATLYDSSDTVLQTVTVNPEETDYSLAGTVNTAFDFVSLPVGTNYKFTLEGATELTAERFYTSTFRIIKAPLSVRLTEFSTPGNYIALGEEKTVEGAVVSNYAITSVALTFTYDVSDGEGNITETDTVIYRDQSTGNLKNYDLSSLSAGFYSAKNSEVHMELTVTADDQTKTIYEKDYIVTDEVTPTGLILDSTKLNSFVRTKDNRDFFSYYSTYAGNVANAYATSDEDRAKLQLYLINQSGYKEAAVEQFFAEVITGNLNQKNSYYVNLYKDEITSLINEIGAGWISDVGYNEELSYEVQTAIAAYPRLKTDAVDALKNKTGMTSEELSIINMLVQQIDTLSPLLDSIDSADDIQDFAEVIYRVMVDYTCGLNVLDYLENTHKSNDEQDGYYQTAIRELRKTYVGSYTARVDKVFDYLKKEAISLAIKTGEKTLKSAVTTAVESILGITFGGEIKLILGITKILIKVYTDQTDFYKGAKQYTGFMTKYSTYLQALYSYQEYFDAANKAPTSEEAKKKLMTSFNVTRLAGIRVLRELRTMDHVEGNNDYEILQELRKLVGYVNYFYVEE